MTLELTIQVFVCITLVAMIVLAYLGNKPTKDTGIDVQTLIRREAENRYKKNHPVVHAVITTLFSKGN